MTTVYTTGTITVSNGSTTVTGSGTAWNTAGIKAGDHFWGAGLSVRVASVDSATQITLAYAWPGSSLSGANYEIRLIEDDIRALAAANLLLQALGTNGNLTSLGSLTTAANKLPYFTGAGVAAVTDLTAWGRSLLDDANAAAFWATIGATSGAAQAFRRGNILGTVSQSGGVPTGGAFQYGFVSGKGHYLRFADGTQVCWHLLADNAAINVAFLGGFRDAGRTWSLPIAFASAPVVSGSPQALTSAGVTAPTSTTTGASVFHTAFASQAAADLEADLIAIGRWY